LRDIHLRLLQHGLSPTPINTPSRASTRAQNPILNPTLPTVLRGRSTPEHAHELGENPQHRARRVEHARRIRGIQRA